MSKNIVLEVENVSKQYRLGEVGTGSLQHDVKRWWANIRGQEDPFLKIGETNDRTKKGDSDYVWALKDINFQIEQGQAVGIIGRNGAGKSTLLKLLSRVTRPTTGSIKYNGRIASLLEVGTGFHPEMTGRENIYLNGAILGMTRKEITRKFDEIVDFAGVERYIDTPVKRYSSGMYVRLAFAVAAYLESEILIVDEVLAVGDTEFQKKCLGKMNDVTKGEGRTVLFVSHNMASMRELCQEGIYMENGTVKHIGEINEAINIYQGDSEIKNVWIGNLDNEFINVTKTTIYNENSDTVLDKCEDIFIQIDLEILDDLKEIGIGFYLKSMYDDNLMRCFFNDYNELNNLKKGKHQIIFRIPADTLAEGSYKIIFDVSIPKIIEFTQAKCNLFFELINTKNNGNRCQLQHVQTFGSIFRPDYFHDIISL
ncbi:polysaccharide ABC transporter ATP-binding protein [Algoriella sp.]|uniref:ABC transporter ATP-binding protein n=1 Tax=Algoriella sp. TaxID=1872434 RepID=UPI001B1CD594|nr:polysaccharide ABC transporter ATP-binding protein [Algoriella sp.]MBO6211897.1 ATP-binding cassette domain-containing protein [Algoriella sp.]